MNFRDRLEENEDGNQFIFTVEMQRRLSGAGLPVEPDSLADLGDVAIAAPPRKREEAPPRSQPREEIEGPESIQIDPMTGRYIGRVKWYNGKKGYGFIMRGAGEEIFFHRSNSSADPQEFEEGRWVLYDVEETNKGPEATDVGAYDQDSEEE